MIDYIRGILAELTPTLAVVEAGGVGYAVNITLPAYSGLAGKENAECRLYVTEIIREDTHDLFGFPNKGERALFDMLLTVSGIGANTARMILSAFSAAEVRQIIATGNAKALSQVKGLGPKTAQRVIVDLKDKVLKIELDDTAEAMAAAELPDMTSPVTEVKEEAVGALTMLGFQAAASGKAVDKILKEDPTLAVEKVIKIALKML